MATLGDHFTFYVATKLEDQLTDFVEPGHILNYQDLASSTLHYNGVSFSNVLPENPVEDGGDGDDFFYDNVIVWNTPKLNSSHSVTAGEGDKTRGNRLLSIPVLIERVGTEISELLLAISHIHSGTIRYVTYNVGDNTVEIEPLILTETIEAVPISSYLGLNVALSTSEGGDTDFIGLGGLTYTLNQTLTHYYGTVVAYSGRNLIIELDSVPADPGDLLGLKYFSLGKQQMTMLPLGYHLTGSTDQFDELPSAYNIPGWTYYEDNNHRVPQTPTISPSLKLTFPNVGDRFKLIMQLERDLGRFPTSNGMFLLPTVLN